MNLFADRDPRPEEAEVSANISSPHYEGTAGVTYFESFQEPIAAGGSFLSVPLYQPFVGPTDDVVDFACGGGHLLTLLEGGRKFGIEVNAVAAAAARRRGIEVFERLEDMPSQSVDVIISNHGLEHTLRPFDVLRGLHRVARPEGRLVLYLPADSWWRQRTFRRGDINHHLYTWTPLLLGNLLADAGWDVRVTKLVFHAWPPRGYRSLRYFPSGMAQAICRLCALMLVQPQVHAYAVKTTP